MDSSQTDLQHLPEHLRTASFSDQEIVLPYKEAVEALHLLTEKHVSLTGWEGWILRPDGTMTHSLKHQGTRGESASLEVLEETIRTSQQEWEADPEITGSRLLFCIGIGKIF
jgi:hypothetical protein